MKIGTILVDRYQIREQLSQKAGRSTFLAEDFQSQNLVIIKILSFDVNFQWDDLKLFEREAHTLKNLSHPAIPQYLDYFDVETAEIRGFALVQTYIEATSLESVVRAGRKFSELEVIELADRLLSILTYLHEQNPPVIHRDIKPSNILLTNRSGNSVGDVYLVDFGSVQTAASKDGGTITIVGSYGYMPLEQFGGQTTTASDLYSLGMTIIYLLTGTHPAELAQVNGQVKFAAEISKKFHRWVEKITQPHLEKRFNAAKSAQIALKSEDGSYGDFIHLKPANSQVELYRDQNTLEIKFLSIKDNLWIWVIGCILFPFTMMFSVDILWPILGVFAILVGPAIYFIALVYIGKLIRQYKLYTIRVVSITREPKSLRKGRCLKKNNNIKWDKLELLELDTLVYSPGYNFNKYIDREGKLNSGDIRIAPELYFYNYGKDLINETGGILSDDELRWLGQEISDFLNIELQIIYATPRLPEVSQSSCGGC